MINQQQAARVAARYVHFAEDEARDRSPLYETLARGVAASPDAIGFLLTLPQEKQQPNLLLAAYRHLFGVPVNCPHFLHTLLENADAVRTVMLARSTQTNEAARCATLLPVLARLPQPLALIEVGTSAGLCLLPDCYGYDYGGRLIGRNETGATRPVFRCSVSETTPVPTTMPRIVWRAGLDRNPLDAADPTQAAWLETLVWPEQFERLANLRAALGIAATQRPRIVAGDLLGDGLAELCGEAPKDATLVIFHSAVLAYVADAAQRRRFADRAMSLGRYWICNESPRIFPEIATRAGCHAAPGCFLLSVNGSPVAWTDPHGASIEWIANEGWPQTDEERPAALCVER